MRRCSSHGSSRGLCRELAGGGFSSAPATGLVQLELEHLPVLKKVLVGGVDGEPPPKGDRTDQKVGVRALDTALATAVESFGGCLEVHRIELEIGKGSQVVAQQLELSADLDAGQQLLSDGSQH